MTIRINEERCVKCGLCVTQCQYDVFAGEGEYRVGQSKVYEAITLDNDNCTDCGECTDYQFWCPAEAVFDDTADQSPGKENRVEVSQNGKKYEQLFYQYKHGDDPFLMNISDEIPFNQVTRFNTDTFPIPGCQFNWVQWIMPHDKPFLDLGHPPHIHKDPELLFFIGGDPENPSELNSEIEFYMGVELEKYVITKSCVIYIPPNVVHSPWKPLYTTRPWIFIEVNQGPTHTEKGYHQCLNENQWGHPDLQRESFADDKY